MSRSFCLLLICLRFTNYKVVGFFPKSLIWVTCSFFIRRNTGHHDSSSCRRALLGRKRMWGNCYVKTWVCICSVPLLIHVSTLLSLYFNLQQCFGLKEYNVLWTSKAQFSSLQRWATLNHHHFQDQVSTSCIYMLWVLCQPDSGLCCLCISAKSQGTNHHGFCYSAWYSHQFWCVSKISSGQAWKVRSRVEKSLIWRSQERACQATVRTITCLF